MRIYDTRVPGVPRPFGYVELGPGVDPELDRRLLGDIGGRHALVLGCGAGHDAVGLARRGARVVTVDPDPTQLAAARELAAAADVVVAFRLAELADLAFIGADQIDVAVSIHALSLLPDLHRVFRQVHRVLRHGAHFVISVPHAAALCADPADPNRAIRRWDAIEPVGERWVHRVEDVITALRRAGFEIDTLIEHHQDGPDAGLMPDTLIARGEKLGT